MSTKVLDKFTLTNMTNYLSDCRKYLLFILCKLAFQLEMVSVVKCLDFNGVSLQCFM